MSKFAIYSCSCVATVYLFSTVDRLETHLCHFSGTVIAIHQADRGFGDPILNRLKQRDSVLRTTADPSLLLEAILDLGT